MGRNFASKEDLIAAIAGSACMRRRAAHVEPAIIERHLDLIRAGVTMVPGAAPLRGRAPTLEDLGLQGS